MYGKLESGILKYAPSTFITEEVTIFNFNKDVDTMLKYGFKVIIEEIPPYNKETQGVKFDRYEETENSIIIKYSVIEIEIGLNIEDEVKRIDSELQATQSAVDFILFNNMGLNEYKNKMDYNKIVKNVNERGRGSMGAYLAMRVIKGMISYADVISHYSEFKEDVDIILKAEGYGDLIKETPPKKSI